MEITIYFASINYATKFQESDTSLIAPHGKYIVHQSYGEAEIIVADIYLSLATAILAKRFNKELYA